MTKFNKRILSLSLSPNNFIWQRSAGLTRQIASSFSFQRGRIHRYCRSYRHERHLYVDRSFRTNLSTHHHTKIKVWKYRAVHKREEVTSLVFYFVVTFVSSACFTLAWDAQRVRTVPSGNTIGGNRCTWGREWW